MFIGVLDPNDSIRGLGQLRLRDAGIEVALFDPDLMPQIEELNRDFARQHRPVPAPDLISDSATLASRPALRETSAAELVANLKDTPSYEFRKTVEHLLAGRWTREPGWQATVHAHPTKLSERLWHCSFQEVGDGPLVFATTVQDVSSLRVGDLVTVSGKITDVSPLKYVTLEDALVRCEHVL